MLKATIVAGVIVSTLACGSAQAGDKLGAFLGGAAVGAVGGAVLGSALAQPRPVYVAPPPPPVYLAPPPPRTMVVARDPFDDRVYDLHERCDDGDRRACIRFGIMIGQHRERVAEWHHTHPDFFSYED